MPKHIKHEDETVQRVAKRIQKLGDYGHSSADIFRDWIGLMFNALSQVAEASPEVRKRREAAYMEIVHRYTRGKPRDSGEYSAKRGYEIVDAMPELMAEIAVPLSGEDGDVRDILGDIAGSLETVLNAGLGQFFTPSSVSRMMARMQITHEHVKSTVAKRGYMTVAEPACGSGGMILQVAQTMREVGYDPGKHLFARLTDKAPLAFQMAYIQMHLAGVSAHVLLGDGLTVPDYAEPDDIVQTPAYAIKFIPHRAEFQKPTVPTRRAPPQPHKIAAE